MGDDSVRARGVDEALDFEAYLPLVVSRLLGRLRSSSTAFLRARYGLSLLEWVVLSFLAGEGRASAYDVWTQGDLDRAAVIRAVRGLKARGLVETAPVEGSRRGKALLTLTGEGRRMHDESLAETLARHARLVGGLSRAEVEAFIATARRLESNVPSMGDPAAPASSGLRPTRPAGSKRAAGPRGGER